MLVYAPRIMKLVMEERDCVSEGDIKSTCQFRFLDMFVCRSECGSVPKQNTHPIKMLSKLLPPLLVIEALFWFVWAERELAAETTCALALVVLVFLVCS